MGFQSKRRRHLDKVRPGGKKQCAGQQQDNEEQQHGGTRGKQGDNNAQRMEDEDFKDEKPEENPLGDVIEGTTHQKAQKGEVDEEEGAVQKDGNGATGTNDQAQGSSKKALPSYQRLDKNFLKATLPKIVKLSRTEIAQDLRVMKSEHNAMLQTV